MTTVSRKQLEELARLGAGPCVSIYQPTDHAGVDARRHARQLRVCFNTLVREAAQRLTARGLAARDAERLLQPAPRLFGDQMVGPPEGRGLAVFVSPHVARAFPLPTRVGPLVAVGPHFHLTPLAGAMTPTRLFYVLALSQSDSRLFRATADDIVEVKLPGVPRTLREALQRRSRERHLQFHTGTPRRHTRRAAVFHGHAHDGKADIARFVRDVERGATAAMRRAPGPLVLAAMKYLIPLYAAANTYRWLLDDCIAANPRPLTPVELHARARPLVDAHHAHARESAAARYRGLRGTGKAANDVDSVVAAALDGRIDVLFVALGLDAPTVPSATVTSGCREDLLNVAVVHTILNRGSVYAVPPPQMPDEASVAALFRY